MFLSLALIHVQSGFVATMLMIPALDGFSDDEAETTARARKETNIKRKNQQGFDIKMMGAIIIEKESCCVPEGYYYHSDNEPGLFDL